MALAVTCLWCAVIVIAVLSNDAEPKSVKNEVGNHIIESTSSKDTFGLMETAEMNNVQSHNDKL